MRLRDLVAAAKAGKMVRCRNCDCALENEGRGALRELYVHAITGDIYHSGSIFRLTSACGCEWVDKTLARNIRLAKPGEKP